MLNWYQKKINDGYHLQTIAYVSGSVWGSVNTYLCSLAFTVVLLSHFAGYKIEAQTRIGDPLNYTWLIQLMLKTSYEVEMIINPFCI